MAKHTLGASIKRNTMGDFISQSAIVWKTALGSIIVWELSRFTGSGHPYLAPLTFILCLQATIGQSVRYAVYRSAGTVIGVLFIGMFAKSIPVTAWALGLVLLATTLIMKLFRANDFLIHQVALSVLFVLYFENHSSGYAWDRAKDTLIGAIVALIFTILIFPPNEVKKLRQDMSQFVQHFVSMVNQVSSDLLSDLPFSTAMTPAQIDSLLDDLGQIGQSLKKVEQGYPAMVYVKASDVQRLQQAFHGLRDACMFFVVLTKSFTDETSKEQRLQWSFRLNALASEMTGWTDDAQLRNAPTTFQDTMSAYEREVSRGAFEKILGSFRRSKG